MPEKGLSGDSIAINRRYLDHLLVESRIVGAVHPDPTVKLFHHTFSTPITTGALSHLQPGMKAFAEGAAQAGAACSDLPKLPGLGPILRATLAARLPELGTVPARKIVALVGLAPFNRDSGRWRGLRRIQGGRADVRRVLYMATWASIRTGSPLAHTYARLTAAGKPAKVAIVACMHKYLRWLNAIARDRAPYAPPAIADA
jgi:transposase